MFLREVDGENFKILISGGAGMLAANEKMVNDLNVFPVPDGDTGTNMCFTMRGAVKGVNSTNGSLSDVSKAMAKGALLGARGNSGVILSQFLKGISVGFKDLEKATVQDVANAFTLGVEYAYKSVLKPTEGTILTVIREATAYAVGAVTEDETISDFFEAFLKRGNHKGFPLFKDVLFSLRINFFDDFCNVICIDMTNKVSADSVSQVNAVL